MNAKWFQKRSLRETAGFILLGGILLAGCAASSQYPAASTSVTPTVEKPTLKAHHASTVRSPEKPTAASVIASPPVAEGDGINQELVFAIRNEGRYSGENGQPAWFGWGADHIATAPDGSFWIADTPADPDRLLHYNPRGELLATISLQIDHQQYWARDLFADASGLWVLDNIAQPGKVLHLDSDGAMLGSYTIPNVFATFRQEDSEMPGLWYIVFTEHNRVLLEGPAGIVELSISGSQSAFKRLDGYPIGDHFYSLVENGTLVDGQLAPVEFVQPEHLLNHFRLLGASDDGSFFIQEGEANADQGKAKPPDEFVRRYDSSGRLSGIALLPIPEVHQQPDLALGPDGKVYALYSYTDHSVEIYNLEFYTRPAPLLAPVRQTPKTYFGPLLPNGIAPATDLDAARETMLTFFANLANQKYNEAAARYGGTYTHAIAQNVVTASDTPGIAWQNICQSLFCLPVSDILDSRQLAGDTYEFLIGFVHENGFRYNYGPCCGYFQPIPTSTWFVYSVTVQKVNMNWVVMGSPKPLP